MAGNRRMGGESSLSRTALIDAVEAVMRDDGYAALTARRVADHAGLNYQLVFYYFGTMDELLVTTYRRHIDKYREAMKLALRSDRPLHAYWRVHSNPTDAVLNMEFMALSNHNEAIRAETIRFGEEFRKSSLDDLGPVIEAITSADGAITPAAVMMVLNYVGSLVGLETALGITGVHDEIRTLVNWCVDKLEPEGLVAGPGSAGR